MGEIFICIGTLRHKKFSGSGLKTPGVTVSVEKRDMKIF